MFLYSLSHSRCGGLGMAPNKKRKNRRITRSGASKTAFVGLRCDFFTFVSQRRREKDFVFSRKDEGFHGSSKFSSGRGYTAPEYAIRGELSEKADIYSFGVLVLEIISCRKNTDLTLPSEMQYLPEYAWRLYEKSKWIELVDPKICEDGVVEKEIMQVLHVAFLCLQRHANLRPPMSDIVAMLTCGVDMAGTPVRPAFLDRKRKNDNEKPSWEAVSEALPSPKPSDSASFPTTASTKLDAFFIP